MLHRDTHTHMPIVKIIQGGDLLRAPESHIVQQCNCCTVRAHGLSESIAKKYPWADVYGMRDAIGHRNCATEGSRPTPGTIHVISHPDAGVSVVCMFAQWAPGKPLAYGSYPKDHHDSAANRQVWFQACLDALDDMHLDAAVAMPHSIGCGLAGGHWPAYEQMLARAKTKIVLYKR